MYLFLYLIFYFPGDSRTEEIDSSPQKMGCTEEEEVQTGAKGAMNRCEGSFFFLALGFILNHLLAVHLFEEDFLYDSISFSAQQNVISRVISVYIVFFPDCRWSEGKGEGWYGKGDRQLKKKRGSIAMGNINTVRQSTTPSGNTLISWNVTTPTLSKEVADKQVDTNRSRHRIK